MSEKIWYRTKSDLFAAKGGQVDYVFISSGFSIEKHIGDVIQNELYTPQEEPKCEEGKTYFGVVDLLIDNDSFDEGIFIGLDDYYRLSKDADDGADDT